MLFNDPVPTEETSSRDLMRKAISSQIFERWDSPTRYIYSYDIDSPENKGEKKYYIQSSDHLPLIVKEKLINLKLIDEEAELQNLKVLDIQENNGEEYVKVVLEARGAINGIPWFVQYGIKQTQINRFQIIEKSPLLPNDHNLVKKDSELSETELDLALNSLYILHNLRDIRTCRRMETDIMLLQMTRDLVSLGKFARYKVGDSISYPFPYGGVVLLSKSENKGNLVVELKQGKDQWSSHWIKRFKGYWEFLIERKRYQLYDDVSNNLRPKDVYMFREILDSIILNLQHP